MTRQATPQLQSHHTCMRDLLPKAMEQPWACIILPATIQNTAVFTNNKNEITTVNQNAAQLLALDSCSVGFAAFCPREALSSLVLPPKPKLPKPDPSTPRVLATMPADDQVSQKSMMLLNLQGSCCHRDAQDMARISSMLERVCHMMPSTGCNGSRQRQHVKFVT